MVYRIIAAAILVIAFAPAAHAVVPLSGSVTVAYRDLDLGSVAGRGELNNRLRAAGGTLCSPILAWRPDSEPSIREHRIYNNACVGRLAMRALARIEASHPALGDQAAK